MTPNTYKIKPKTLYLSTFTEIVRNSLASYGTKDLVKELQRRGFRVSLYERMNI